jgi:lipoate-protein ligase A
VTIGCFQKLTDIDTGICKERSVPVIRRPTGGRAILHWEEITYSFAAAGDKHDSFMNLFDSYRSLSDTFLSAFNYMGMDASVRDRREKGHVLSRDPSCFKAVSFGEIVVKGHKIIGSAQKRYRTGFLQQGSILFHIDKDLYRDIFQNQNEPAGLRDLYPDITMEHMKHSIQKAFERIYTIRLEKRGLIEEESLLARDLLERKYHSPEWTRRR